MSRAFCKGGDYMLSQNMPYITKWSIYVDPEHGDRATEKMWAGKLADFLETAKVGDVINFYDLSNPQYTFGVYGVVHGESGDDYKEGDTVLTGAVRSFERVQNGYFGAEYAVHIGSSKVYYVNGNESKALIRATATM